ncbi:hypothetical protein PQX77_010661 [Marasmius sp. AFHP31]|nr:hypothetical protein PQX77_010661 [Marasmius sp. AFHP31]
MTKLEHESRVKRFLRLVSANTVKEDLAAFRKELGDAQMVFVTTNVCAIRLELHDAVRSLSRTTDNGETSGIIKGDLTTFGKELGEAQTDLVTSVRLEVDDAVHVLKKTTQVATFNLVVFL